jgi:hypothetical protein
VPELAIKRHKKGFGKNRPKKNRQENGWQKKQFLEVKSPGFTYSKFKYV